MFKRHLFAASCAAMYILGGILLGSCDTTADPESFTPFYDGPGEFDFKGAKALALKSSNTRADGLDGPEPNLFKIDENGEVSPAVTGIKIREIYPLDAGILVYADYNAYYFINHDEAVLDLSEAVHQQFGNEGYLGSYMGSTDEGTLVFDNGFFFDTTEAKISKLESSMKNVYFNRLTGNYLIGQADSVDKFILEISSSRRHLTSCMSSAINFFKSSLLYLSSSYAYDECMGLGYKNRGKLAFYDFAKGETFEASAWDLHDYDSTISYDTHEWDESLREEEGLIILSSNNENLIQVKTDGTRTPLTQDGDLENIASSSYYRSVNTVLFGSERHLVVRGKTEIYIIDRNDNTVSTINEVSGKIVTGVSFEFPNVYYLADTSIGKPIIGSYNVTNRQKLFDDIEERYDTIAVIKDRR